MKNIHVNVEGDELVVRINLKEDQGLSSTKKSTLIGTSEGNVEVPDAPGIMMGINVFRPLKTK